jgi:VanZ family protein
MPSVQAAVWRWASVVAWAALIFVLSSMSAFGTDLGVWEFILPKAVHLLEFAVLGFLLLWATRREGVALVLGIAYAASDELHQRFVPGRHGSVSDVVIDTLGVALGIYLARRAGLRRVGD